MFKGFGGMKDNLNKFREFVELNIYFFYPQAHMDLDDAALNALLDEIESAPLASCGLEIKTAPTTSCGFAPTSTLRKDFN